VGYDARTSRPGCCRPAVAKARRQFCIRTRMPSILGLDDVRPFNTASAPDPDLRQRRKLETISDYFRYAFDPEADRNQACRSSTCIVTNGEPFEVLAWSSYRFAWRHGRGKPPSAIRFGQAAVSYGSQRYSRVV